MKVATILASAAALLCAVPGAFSEEHAAAGGLRKSLTGVLDAVAEESAGAVEFDFDEAEPAVMKKEDKDKKSKDKDKRKYKGRRKGMCGRNMRSRDKKTCRQLEKEFCDSKKERKRNKDLCCFLGFRTSAMGAVENAVEITNCFRDDAVETDADVVAEWELIVDDVEDEIYDDEDFEDRRGRPPRGLDCPEGARKCKSKHFAYWICKPAECHRPDSEDTSRF